MSCNYEESALPWSFVAGFDTAAGECCSKDVARVVMLVNVRVDGATCTVRRLHDSAAAARLLRRVRILAPRYRRPDGWDHVVSGTVTVGDNAVRKLASLLFGFRRRPLKGLCYLTSWQQC